MTLYAFTGELDADFDSAVQIVKDHLRLEGFGVVTTIDMKDKLQEKPGIDFCNYAVLGACDPVLAAIKPTVTTEMIDNLDLRRIAKDVERRLKHAMDCLAPIEAVP
jgi:hypothetical protein